MFGSTVLEVALGMVFMFLILSVVCSTVNEWLAGILRLRAKTLEIGIRNLLNDPKGQAIAGAVYEHPLIKTLGSRLGNRKPSYIPAPAFALALLDVLAPRDPEKGPKSVQEVRASVLNLNDGELRRVLLTVLDEAEDDLKKARENLARWFDAGMDRVSGWYRRRTQLIILAIALVVGAIVNADAFMIAAGLWRDATVRASIVAIAQETARQPGPDVGRVRTDFEEALRQVRIPAGWSTIRGDPKALPVGFRSWFMKVAGLLFTTVAVSLGAPLWFDLMNRIVGLRLAGKPPAKTGTASEE